MSEETKPITRAKAVKAMQSAMMRGDDAETYRFGLMVDEIDMAAEGKARTDTVNGFFSADGYNTVFGGGSSSPFPY